MKNQDEVYIVQSEAEIDLLVGRFHHRHLNFVLVNIHLRVHRVNWSSISHLDPNRLCKLLMSSSVDTDTPLIPLYRHICEAIWRGQQQESIWPKQNVWTRKFSVKIEMHVILGYGVTSSTREDLAIWSSQTARVIPPTRNHEWNAK